VEQNLAHLDPQIFNGWFYYKSGGSKYDLNYKSESNVIWLGNHSVKYIENLIYLTSHLRAASAHTYYMFKVLSGTTCLKY
jgi:hypothetical protein